jgi:hypothetical protein
MARPRKCPAGEVSLLIPGGPMPMKPPSYTKKAGHSIQPEITERRSLLGAMNEFGHMADRYRWAHDEIDLAFLAVWLADTPSSPRRPLSSPTMS